MDILNKEEARKLEYFFDGWNNITYSYIPVDSKHWVIIVDWKQVLQNKEIRTLYIDNDCHIISWHLDKKTLEWKELNRMFGNGYSYFYDAKTWKDILEGKHAIHVDTTVNTNKCLDGINYLDDNFRWHLLLNNKDTLYDILENKQIATAKDIFDNIVYYYPEWWMYNYKDIEWYWNLIRIKDDYLIKRNLVNTHNIGIYKVYNVFRS